MRCRNKVSDKSKSYWKYLLYDSKVSRSRSNYGFEPMHLPHQIQIQTTILAETIFILDIIYQMRKLLELILIFVWNKCLE